MYQLWERPLCWRYSEGRLQCIQSSYDIDANIAHTYYL